MDIAAIGAGYVGLVTAACLAHVGHDVVCIDVDEERIARLHQGELPVHEPGLDELVAEGLAAGRLRFASQAGAMAGRELVIVCVGTLDADEEWSGDIVRAAVDIVADPTLPRSIVIRSTLLPGTAADIGRGRAVDRPSHRPQPGVHA
jgi:UDPglucose 6-dehydrogenase